MQKGPVDQIVRLAWEHLGAMHERRGEIESSLHAARIALDAAIRSVGELNELEQLKISSPVISSNARKSYNREFQGEPRLHAGRAPRPGPPGLGARRRPGLCAVVASATWVRLKPWRTVSRTERSCWKFMGATELR